MKIDPAIIEECRRQPRTPEGLAQIFRLQPEDSYYQHTVGLDYDNPEDEFLGCHIGWAVWASKGPWDVFYPCMALAEDFGADREQLASIFWGDTRTGEEAAECLLEGKHMSVYSE